MIGRMIVPINRDQNTLSAPDRGPPAPVQGGNGHGGGASLAGTPLGALPPASGLVLLKTSDTQPVEIDQKRARFARMRRSILWGSDLIQRELGSQGYKPAMLTLTYRDVDGFGPRHISELLKRIRHWLKNRRRRLHYVWVAELQQRGALHYHVVIWLPRGLTLPKPDKQGWWPHGSTKIEWARRAVGYLLKYASKFDTKHQLPKGVRLHGNGGLDE